MRTLKSLSFRVSAHNVKADFDRDHNFCFRLIFLKKKSRSKSRSPFFDVVNTFDNDGRHEVVNTNDLNRGLLKKIGCCEQGLHYGSVYITTWNIKNTRDMVLN